MSDRNCARRPNTFFLSSTDKKKGKKIKTRATINRRNNEKKKQRNKRRTVTSSGRPDTAPTNPSPSPRSWADPPLEKENRVVRIRNRIVFFLLFESNRRFYYTNQNKRETHKKRKKNTQPTGAVDRSIQRFTSLAAGHSLRPKLENKNLKKKDAFFWNRWSGNQLGPTLLSLCWLH